jgi:hypothetical protein
VASSRGFSDEGARVMAVQKWFDRTLPALLVSRFDDFLAVSGAISFKVGEGAWTLTFGDVENPVSAGAIPDADLRLTFTPPAFEQFIEGTLDPVAAIGSGDIKASGDLELLSVLATMMMPLQRDLGWDAT